MTLKTPFLQNTKEWLIIIREAWRNFNSLSPLCLFPNLSINWKYIWTHGPCFPIWHQKNCSLELYTFTLLWPLSQIPFLPQSWKWKITLNERKLTLEGPIFHFHDYGRKGKQFWDLYSRDAPILVLVSMSCISFASPVEALAAENGATATEATFAFREKNNFGHKELQLSSTNSQFRQWTVCKIGKNWIWFFHFLVWDFFHFLHPTKLANWKELDLMLFFGMGIFHFLHPRLLNNYHPFWCPKKSPPIAFQRCLVV